MVVWSEGEIHIVNTALIGWLADEEEFMLNVRASVSLSVSEKEMLLLSSKQKVDKIKKLVNKINRG